MSITTKQQLENYGTLYKLLYGSDIRLKATEGKGYMSLDFSNGDFDLVGAVSGNQFADITNLITQRFLNLLYTPSNGVLGSNFIAYSREVDLPIEMKRQLLEVELTLVASKIPQIAEVHRVDSSVNGSVLTLLIEFTLITGEDAKIEISE